MCFVPKDLGFGAIILNADIPILTACNDEVVGTTDRANSAGVDIGHGVIVRLVKVKNFDMSQIISDRDF